MTPINIQDKNVKWYSFLYLGTAVLYYDDYCLGRKAWAGND